MVEVPSDPPIFHITHFDNLAGILADDCLWSDSVCMSRGVRNTNIGHRHIKRRRLERTVELPPRGKLGNYVPFNFCPRSVMLCAIDRGHQDYAGGQSDIVHLVSRVSVVTASGRPWLFTDRHAELAYAQYFDKLDDLHEVPWHVMRRTYWSDVKEERQAEFLVHEHLAWSCIVGVGVHNLRMKERVEQAFAAHNHRPRVTVEPRWYY